jgi:hypothetical protein
VVKQHAGCAASNTGDHLVLKSTSFAEGENLGTKVLGLHWYPYDDCLICELNLDTQIVYTKRGVLSLTAQFFDPFGLSAPSIFLAKHIMQRTWDGPLPPEIRADWAQFVIELPELSSVQIPRFCNTAPGAACSLFGFGDASLRDYAAVIYLRVLDAPRESSVFLVGTKTKLAPIKPLTVPRLELNAAVLLSRWLSHVKSVLYNCVKIVDTYAWTDSMVVLSWLTTPHETFKQYVSNRVHQVQTALPDGQWRYVSSSDNPADCASRGLMPSELARHELYWCGPHFIYDAPENWGNDVVRISHSKFPEVRPVSLAVQRNDPPVEWFSRFSSYDRMLRVIVQMRHFTLKCRLRPVEPTRLITLDEIDDALRIVVLSSQKLFFSYPRISCSYE